MRTGQRNIICDQCRVYHPAAKVTKRKGMYLCEKCLTNDINHDNMKNKKVGLVEKLFGKKFVPGKY